MGARGHNIIKCTNVSHSWYCCGGPKERCGCGQWDSWRRWNEVSLKQCLFTYVSSGYQRAWTSQRVCWINKWVWGWLLELLGLEWRWRSILWGQDWLHGCVTRSTAQDPWFEGPHAWLMCFHVILKFFMTFEQEDPNFHFSLGPTNYVAGSRF